MFNCIRVYSTSRNKIKSMALNLLVTVLFIFQYMATSLILKSAKRKAFLQLSRILKSRMFQKIRLIITYLTSYVLSTRSKISPSTVITLDRYSSSVSPSLFLPIKISLSMSDWSVLVVGFVCLQELPNLFE